MKRTFIYDPANPRRDGVLQLLIQVIAAAGHAVEIRLSKPTRSSEQNRLMWAMLNDIAQQVEWPVDGKQQRLSSEDWKNILTAGLTKEQRIAQGINGGFVMLGNRTSQMSKAELSDLIEFAFAFGAQQGVEWSDNEAQGRAYELDAIADSEPDPTD